MSEHTSDKSNNLVLLEVDAIGVFLIPVVAKSDDEVSNSLVQIFIHSKQNFGVLDDSIKNFLVAVILANDEIVECEVDVHADSGLELDCDFLWGARIAGNELHCGDNSTLSDVSPLDASLCVEGDLVEVSCCLVLEAEFHFDLNIITVVGCNLRESFDRLSGQVRAVKYLGSIEHKGVEDALMNEDLFSLLSIDKLSEMAWRHCSNGVGRSVNESTVHVDLNETFLR